MKLREYWEETKRLIKNQVEAIQRREQGIGAAPIQHPNIQASGVNALVSRPAPIPQTQPKPVAFPNAMDNTRGLGTIEDKPNMPSISSQQHERLREGQRSSLSPVKVNPQNQPLQTHQISMTLPSTDPNQKGQTVDFNKLVNLNNLDEAVRGGGFDKTKNKNRPLDKMTTDKLFQAQNIPVDYLIKLHSELSRNIDHAQSNDQNTYPSVQTTSGHMLHNLRHLIASKIYHARKQSQGPGQLTNTPGI